MNNTGYKVSLPEVVFGLLVAVIKSIHSKRLQIKMIKIPAVYFDISEPVWNIYFVFNIGLYQWGNM